MRLKKREFHSKARTGKTRVWTIEVRGSKVITTYGELDGKMQQVVDEGQWKNEGKANEISPEVDALYLAERAILKKTRAGYRPVGEEPPTEISWHEALPKNLCFYKPDNTLSARLQKLMRDGKAWLGRKRDGEMLAVVKGLDGAVDIYSRRMLVQHHLEEGTELTWNTRFHHLVEELEGRDDIPPGTVLLGDLVTDPEEDERWAVASIMKSLTEEALRTQDHYGNLFLYVWDIAFWDTDDLLTAIPVRERFDLLWSVLGQEWDGQSWFLPVQVFGSGPQIRSMAVGLLKEIPDDPIDVAKEFAKALDWEGWVVVDPDGVFGDRGYNFRGKPDRPGKYSGKLKPVYEDDFLAEFDPDGVYGERNGKWGRGNHRNQVGSVSLYQYTGEGDLVFICHCGGGITDEFRTKYSDPGVYPLVLKVEYTDRTYKSMGDKTNALTYPRVVEVREDKDPEECINWRL